MRHGLALIPALLLTACGSEVQPAADPTPSTSATATQSASPSTNDACDAVLEETVTLAAEVTDGERVTPRQEAMSSLRDVSEDACSPGVTQALAMAAYEWSLAAAEEQITSDLDAVADYSFRGIEQVETAVDLGY